MFGDTPEPDHREIFYDEKIEIKIHRPAGVAWSGVDCGPLSLSWDNWNGELWNNRKIISTEYIALHMSVLQSQSNERGQV